MVAANTMFIFPGQGSQYVGMGSDLCAEYSLAREIYAEANEVLGFDLTALSQEGPEDELGLTRNTQPALLTHQWACLQVYRDLTGIQSPALTGGHSLGEYSALVAAGVISFADGLRLVRRRGELMGEYGIGGMVALTLDVDDATRMADRFYCQVAGCNLPQQTVVGGEDYDLDRLEAALPELYPRKRSTRLKTEGAFHTYLMAGAAREFRRVLDDVEFVDGTCGVLSNYTGKLHAASSRAIRTRLFFQLFNPVNWVACMRTAVEGGITRFVEFGGGMGAGATPAEKKPNLQGITNKNLRVLEHEAEYQSCINVVGLQAAA